MKRRNFSPTMISRHLKPWEKLIESIKKLGLLLKNRQEQSRWFHHSQLLNFILTSNQPKETILTSIVDLRQRMKADWVNHHHQLSLSKQNKSLKILKLITLLSSKAITEIYQSSTLGGLLSKLPQLSNCFGKKEKMQENLLGRMMEDLELQNL